VDPVHQVSQVREVSKVDQENQVKRVDEENQVFQAHQVKPVFQVSMVNPVTEVFPAQLVKASEVIQAHQVFQAHPVFQVLVKTVDQENEVPPVIEVQWVQLEHPVQSVHQGFVIQSNVFQVVLMVLLLLAKKVKPTKMMMLNSVMLILSNKEILLLALLLQVIYIPTVLLLIIFTILLLKLLLHLQYCFLVQWTTQMVTILESRCPIFISMKPKITITTTTTTLNSYNNKIRQTQLNKYNTTNSTTPTPTRALSRSDYSDYYYYDHFALTKPSCTPMIIGLLKTTAHSLQRQSTTTSDDNNDENENCTNPTQKTKMKTNYYIDGLLISATKFSMMIKMMKAKKYLMKNFFFRIFFQNPQFNLFSSFRLSFSQNPHKRYYARYMYKKIMMLKTINLILLFFE
jgi:hypothetical protein